MSLAILIPVLARPWRVKPLLDAVHANTEDFATYFICDYGDDAEVQAIEEDGRYTNLIFCNGNYATKVNTAIRLTEEPYIALFADDLEPQPRWLESAFLHFEVDDTVQVVGLNDMLPRSRELATHFIITREYADRPVISGERGPLFEGYDHSCVDDELLATAKDRGVYAYADDSYIQHLHPDRFLAEWDDTYRRGREHIRDDRELWKSRRWWFLENEVTRVKQ